MFLLIPWIYLLAVCTNVVAEKECIRFNVPMLNSLSVAEKTTKNISFQVINECSTGLNFVFDVLRGYGSTMSPACLTVGPDQLQQGPCRCVKDGLNLSCILTATFDRTKAKWIFQSGAVDDGDRQTIKREEFSINVTYDTTITRFELAGVPNKTVVDAEKGQQLQARCDWERGNPPKDVSIRTKEGILDTKQHSEQPSSHSLLLTNSAKCSDTGQYFCQVDGTDQRKMLTVLVKCPLKFDLSEVTITQGVLLGTEAVFMFRALSYSNTAVSCSLTTPEGQEVSCSDSMRKVTVSGTPPDVLVTVVVKKLTEADAGTWRLSVDNGKGISETSTINFLIVLYETSSTDQPHKLQTEIRRDIGGVPLPDSSVVPMMTGIVGFLVIIIVIGLILVLVHFKRQGGHLACAARGAVTQTDDLPDRESGPHIYEEVPDDAPSTPRRCHHQGQGHTYRSGRSPLTRVVGSLRPTDGPPVLVQSDGVAGVWIPLSHVPSHQTRSNQRLPTH